MPPDFETEYPDNFAESVASDIGEGLFPEKNQEVVEKPAVAAPVVQESTPAAPAPQGEVVPGQNSVGKPLPKSWKKDMAPLWEKADPALHEYVYAREADVMRGFQQYQSGYQQWDTLIKPFAPIFEQHPDVQPIALMQGLMNTHLQLLNPQLPPERKAEMARRIMADYGIDLGSEAGQAPNALNAEVAELRQELFSLKSAAQRQAQEAFQAGVNQQTQMIKAFAADPKNKYFDELGNDILRFLQAGAATDLQSAYDLACYANPAVRAKLLAEQQVTAPAPAPQRNGKGQFVNLEGQEGMKTRTRVGSMDDTIDAVVNAHYQKH